MNGQAEDFNWFSTDPSTPQSGGGTEDGEEAGAEEGYGAPPEHLQRTNQRMQKTMKVYSSTSARNILNARGRGKTRRRLRQRTNSKNSTSSSIGRQESQETGTTDNTDYSEDVDSLNEFLETQSLTSKEKEQKGESSRVENGQPGKESKHAKRKHRHIRGVKAMDAQNIPPPPPDAEALETTTSTDTKSKSGTERNQNGAGTYKKPGLLARKESSSEKPDNKSGNSSSSAQQKPLSASSKSNTTESRGKRTPPRPSTPPRPAKGTLDQSASPRSTSQYEKTETTTVVENTEQRTTSFTTNASAAASQTHSGTKQAAHERANRSTPADNFTSKHAPKMRPPTSALDGSTSVDKSGTSRDRNSQEKSPQVSSSSSNSTAMKTSQEGSHLSRLRQNAGARSDENKSKGGKTWNKSKGAGIRSANTMSNLFSLANFSESDSEHSDVSDNAQSAHRKPSGTPIGKKAPSRPVAPRAPPTPPPTTKTVNIATSAESESAEKNDEPTTPPLPVPSPKHADTLTTESKVSEDTQSFMTGGMKSSDEGKHVEKPPSSSFPSATRTVTEYTKTTAEDEESVEVIVSRDTDVVQPADEPQQKNTETKLQSTPNSNTADESKEPKIDQRCSSSPSSTAKTSTRLVNLMSRVRGKAGASPKAGSDTSTKPASNVSATAARASKSNVKAEDSDKVYSRRRNRGIPVMLATHRLTKLKSDDQFATSPEQRPQSEHSGDSVGKATPPTIPMKSVQSAEVKSDDFTKASPENSVESASAKPALGAKRAPEGAIESQELVDLEQKEKDTKVTQEDREAFIEGIKLLNMERRELLNRMQIMEQRRSMILQNESLTRCRLQSTTEMLGQQAREMTNMHQKAVKDLKAILNRIKYKERQKEFMEGKVDVSSGSPPLKQLPPSLSSSREHSNPSSRGSSPHRTVNARRQQEFSPGGKAFVVKTSLDDLRQTSSPDKGPSAKKSSPRRKKKKKPSPKIQANSFPYPTSAASYTPSNIQSHGSMNNASYESPYQFQESSYHYQLPEALPDDQLLHYRRHLKSLQEQHRQVAGTDLDLEIPSQQHHRRW